MWYGEGKFRRARLMGWRERERKWKFSNFSIANTYATPLSKYEEKGCKHVQSIVPCPYTVIIPHLPYPPLHNFRQSFLSWYEIPFVFIQSPNFSGTLSPFNASICFILEIHRNTFGLQFGVRVGKKCYSGTNTVAYSSCVYSATNTTHTLKFKIEFRFRFRSTEKLQHQQYSCDEWVKTLNEYLCIFFFIIHVFQFQINH